MGKYKLELAPDGVGAFKFTGRFDPIGCVVLTGCSGKENGLSPGGKKSVPPGLDGPRR